MAKLLYSVTHKVLRPLHDDVDRYFTIIDCELQSIERNNFSVVTAGRAQFFLIDVYSGLEHGYTAFDLFNQKATTLDFYQALYNETEDSLSLKHYLAKAFPRLPPEAVNIIILDWISISPNYRGKGLVGRLVEGVVDLFAGQLVGLMVLKPFPLQFKDVTDSGYWQSRAMFEQFSQDKPTVFKKLSCYYERLGFCHIGYKSNGHDGIMARCLI